MKYLVFLVCFSFASLFHFLYTRSIGRGFFLQYSVNTITFSGVLGNFFIEALIFIILGVIGFILFADYKEKDDKSEQPIKIHPKSIIEGIKLFFSRYLYYIGFFLFYLSFYIILSHFSLNFNYFILFVNILVGILFFLNEKFFIFRDLIKVSTILSSFYFIEFYIYTFSQGVVIYTWIDFINSVLVLGYFILNIYFDKKYLKKHESDTWLSVYFFLYLYLFISFYLFLSLHKLSYIFSLTGFLFTFLLFYYIPLFPLFKKNVIPLRYLSLFTSYAALVFSGYYLAFEEFNFIIAAILLTICVFNLYIHINFQNYISFFLSLCGLSFLFYTLYFQYFFVAFQGYKSLFVATYILAIIFIFGSYLKKFYHIFDYIVLYTCFYIAHIYGLVYYFYLSEFDILTFGIMLLLESIISFITYYKINSLLPQDEENGNEHTEHHEHHGHH